MSDIKMSDVFDLPLKVPAHDHIVVWDSKDEFVAVEFMGLGQAEAAVHAINSYDKLAVRNAELEAALEEIIKLDESRHCFEDGETQICNIAANALEY